MKKQCTLTDEGGFEGFEGKDGRQGFEGKATTARNWLRPQPLLLSSKPSSSKGIPGN